MISQCQAHFVDDISQPGRSPHGDTDPPRPISRAACGQPVAGAFAGLASGLGEKALDSYRHAPRCRSGAAGTRGQIAEFRYDLATMIVAVLAMDQVMGF